MKLLYVEWVDSMVAASGWSDTEGTEAIVPAKIRSVGWLLRETGDAITLIAHDGQDEVAGFMVIPKCAIKKRRVLKSP